MEYLIAGMLVLNVALTALGLILRRKGAGEPSVPLEIHDHEAHDAGVLSELRDVSRSGGGRVHIHDVEAVMMRRRIRRRREA